MASGPVRTSITSRSDWGKRGNSAVSSAFGQGIGQGSVLGTVSHPGNLVLGWLEVMSGRQPRLGRLAVKVEARGISCHVGLR